MTIRDQIMGDTDDIFLKRFSIVIAILVGITITILILADRLSDIDTGDNNPSRIALANDRTMPIGSVRTVMPEPVLVAAAPAEPVDPASIDGAAIYASVCQACHMSGAAGAPIPGTALWAERASKGLEALSTSAINGIGTMPAKGGRVDLSDAEVIAAVEHMLAN